MSKKAAIKETLSDENIDAPVRRSTRNLVNPTSTNSPAPKSIGTRRGSGNSIVEKKKPHNADSSPVELAGRRKTRRTSTEEDIKSTPVKTRRSSISKIIEEDKKISSSPKTPSRKVGSRAASTSPSNTTEVPARRTRRSISASQENEVVEQIPLRRSTRRRSSVDTQEDVSNEEVLTKSKPTPRRRRSNSVDENEETTKNDVKSKTKRLYSEDNQLEPIEEHETEVTEKSERKTDETVVEMKRDHNLSVIEESEDAVQKDSNKIIKDIDNMLTNIISSPKPKTVTEKITTRSIFSPMTPKPILSEQNTDVDCEIISSDSDTENELPKSRQSENMKIVSKSDSLKNTSPLKNQSKEESEKETRKTPLSSAKSNKIDSFKENFITNGSDDSFTLNSSKILDKLQTSNNETDEDVFTSPGSNKENNCISVPPKKTENRVVLKEKKSSELSDLDVEDDVFASKTSLTNDDEPMEVDCEDENVEDRSKIDIPDCSDKESKMLNLDKTEQNGMKEQGQEDSEISVQKVTSSGDTHGITETKDISGNVSSKDETSKHSSGRSPENVVINRNEVKSNTPLEDSGNDASCSSTKSNLDVENSFNSLNSNDDNKLDLSFNIFKSPKVYSKQKNSLTSSPGKCADKFTNRKESKDSSVSSEFSLQMIDSDEEDEGKERESGLEQNSNTSKQPQIQIEGNSISESETTISANTNTSMRESETEEGIEEVDNDAAAKEHAELSLEEVAAGSPKKKSKSHQPILEENSSPSDEKSKDENAIEDSPLLKLKINSRKSESKLNEFEKSNPIGKLPRQSFNNKSQDDGDKDTLDLKGVKCEKNNLKIISSPSNNQGQTHCAERSNIVESITESELNSSLKINVIQEIKLSKNIVTELGHSEDSSLSDTYCKKKSKPSHSLNSDSVEINSYVEIEQVEDELIDSEQTPNFSNESSVADEAETEKRHEKSKLNDSLTKLRNKNQIKKKRERDEIKVCEEIDNSEDGNRKEEIVDVNEDNTKAIPTNVEVENQNKQFNPESKQDNGENKVPISDVKTKKDKSTPRIGDRNSKVSGSSRSCDISLSESDVDTDSTTHKSNRASKIEENESSEVAISPLKSKIEKMKSCGINFVNPSPTATRIRLDEKTSKKLDEYLNEKFSALQNEEQEIQSDENKSEDENESRDDHSSSQFLDNMAEEGEEDTPSEGSNDIVDEGESINSKDSEIDSDDTYDSNDSFLVKDDGDDLDLLPGDEYDLGDAPELTQRASKKRRRIVKNLNTSSEEESSPLSSRVSFSDKVEVIPEKKSPRKQILPIKITDKANKNKNNFHTDLQDAQHEESLKEEPDMEIPSIFVDLINDSSEDERPASKQIETPAFDETIRSLIENEKSSTPNVSFNETSNTSKQNNSLRSSSIIIHENVNINEIKEGLLTEKLQQVVSVFCAGIRSSDGNISMNVSLDYVENPSKECDNIKVNDVEQTIKSPVGAKAEANSRHSSNKSEDNNDSINRENLRKRKLSNISPKNIQKQPSLNDFIEEIPVEDLSVLNASFNDETSMLDESAGMMDSGSAKKKRRSSNRKEKQLCNKNIVTSGISCENDKEAANMEEKANKFEESSPKRRRSSNKIEKPLNENLEKSLCEEDFTEKKVEDNSDHEQMKHKSCKSPSIGEKQESKHSNYEQKLYIVKDITDEESEPVKKKKKHNKRKCIEKTSKEVLPEIVTSKRKKLVEMQCDELPANDLRHKLPSFKETSEESNAALKKKKLKRLQSDLKRDLKSTLLSGLVTDVKNRPRRMLKPSIEMDAKDWLIEEAASKPSSANLSKSSFNFNKIDAKDFKNQILYDPRIKREPTSAFLRKKGHY